MKQHAASKESKMFSSIIKFIKSDFEKGQKDTFLSFIDTIYQVSRPEVEFMQRVLECEFTLDEIEILKDVVSQMLVDYDRRFMYVYFHDLDLPSSNQDDIMHVLNAFEKIEYAEEKGVLIYIPI